MDGFALYNIHRKPSGDEGSTCWRSRSSWASTTEPSSSGITISTWATTMLRASELVGCLDSQGHPIPSRHDEDRCLDYAVTKNVTTAFSEFSEHSGSSDHKAFGFFVCGERRVKEPYVWECDGLQNCEERPAKPPHAEACRLGWPMVGESLEVAARRLRWMGCVREQVRERPRGGE